MLAVGFWALCTAFSHNAVSDDAVDTPRPIIDAAQQYLISQVGDEFYSAYYHLDSSRLSDPRPYATKETDTRYRNPYYMVTFGFRMPQYRFVDELLHCNIRTDGEIIECFGIPDCVSKPEECRFDVDGERARQIALEQGLATGIGDWVLSFHWDFEHQTYIWAVSNTLEETLDGATGATVVMDANSGIVYPEMSWIRYDCLNTGA